MVQGVGGTGSTGSIQNVSAYQVYYPLYEQYLQNNSTETQLDFESWLIMKGYVKNFTQQVENYIETGDAKRGDDNTTTLDCNKHLSNSNGSLYQSQDEDTYYEFDWQSGTYRTIQGNNEVAKALGMPDGQNIDRIAFGYMNANIIDYTFGGLDDGQDKSVRNVYGNYGNVGYTNQEFDIDYILNSLLMDPNDPQYQIAKSIFDDLCANTSQWLPDSDMDELDEVAAQYGTNSAEYKAKLKEVLLNNLDQAQEWVDDHNHVKNTALGSLGSVEDANNAGSTDGTDSPEETNTVPDYDKSKILDQAGLLADYTNNSNHKCASISLKGRSSDQARNEALAKANEYASQVLDQAIEALKAQLGEQYTDEIQTYISKAKEAALADTSSWRDYEYDKGLLRKNRHYTGFVKTQPLIDKFFSEFNTLCTNKGKTSEEVAAEKKAAEEKAANEKEAYKGLYNTSMAQEAKDAGSDKDLQVVNVSSAAEIQAKAQSEVLNPLISKLTTKYAGKIPASDLSTLLNNAASYALADCTEWASTTNNYVYNIDSGKLISKFEDAVKQSIKNKGYEF